LPSHGTIGKLGPSLRWLPCTKVGNVHAVSQSHFTLSVDEILQITASVSSALAHPPGFLWLEADHNSRPFQRRADDRRPGRLIPSGEVMAENRTAAMGIHALLNRGAGGIPPHVAPSCCC
jgi:hypothetical protein